MLLNLPEILQRWGEGGFQTTNVAGSGGEESSHCLLAPYHPSLFREMDAYWEFPGGPGMRARRFPCPGPGSVPGRGAKILQAAQRGQKKDTYTSTTFYKKL